MSIPEAIEAVSGYLEGVLSLEDASMALGNLNSNLTLSKARIALIAARQTGRCLLYLGATISIIMYLSDPATFETAIEGITIVNPDITLIEAEKILKEAETILGQNN